MSCNKPQQLNSVIVNTVEKLSSFPPKNKKHNDEMKGNKGNTLQSYLLFEENSST